jgi:uncharacterized RDD family membrane protein YckC
VAYFIDSIIVGVVMAIPIFIIVLIIMLTMGSSFSQMSNSDSQSPNPALFAVFGIMELVIWVGAIIVTWLYFAKMESGPGQATYGKRVMGLKVMDMAGQRLTFGRASGRFFGKIVSGMTMYIGFIMAGFTERKQALHDMIAGTLVIKG